MSEKDFPEVVKKEDYGPCNRSIDHAAHDEIARKTRAYILSKGPGFRIVTVDGEGAIISRAKRTNKSNSHLFRSKQDAKIH